MPQPQPRRPRALRQTARRLAAAGCSDYTLAMEKRVLVVDDEVHVQNLLRMYLERAGYTVETCGDGEAALAAIEHREPDLVRLDVMLPGVNGLELCRQLRGEGDLPIIMLTARTTERDRLRGLREGADDYVTKPFSPPEVVLRVEAVLRRTQRGSAEPEPSTVQIGNIALDREAHLVRVGKREIGLTPTEFRLLEALVTNPGRTFTRQQLLDRIAGPDFGGFDRNVDVHVANLRRKLGIEPSPIRTVYGVGYRLQPEKQ